MNTIMNDSKQLHELIGDLYLSACDQAGILEPPPVAWMSELRDGRRYTHACIFWDDIEELVCDPDGVASLPYTVKDRVLARLQRN